MASTTPLKTSVTELPESRVRVQAEVPAEEVERRVQQAARQLGRQMRIPGFRKGKVPPPVVIRRLGREAVLDEALRSALGQLVRRRHRRNPGSLRWGSPSLTWAIFPPRASRWPSRSRSAFARRPSWVNTRASRWAGASRRSMTAPSTGRSRRLRDRFATLETVERPAETGDHVVIDYLGRIDGEPFEGGEGRDQLLELGSGRLIPGFEEQLVGGLGGRGREPSR